MRQTGNVRFVIVLLLAVSAIGLGALWFINRPGPDKENEKSTEKVDAPADGLDGGQSNAQPADETQPWDEERQRAVELQRDKRWCEATEAWTSVLRKIPPHAKHAADREEAVENERLARFRCRPAKQPVDELPIPPPPENDRPQKAPEQEVLDFYQPGRRVESIGWFTVKGTGSNKKWTLRSNANFLYQYRIVVETVVKQNDGATVVFEQDFKAMDEILAISDQEFEFEFPDSPVLELIWSELVDKQLQFYPPYRLVKRLAQLYESVDPKGKRLLTGLGKFVPGLRELNRLELVERIKDLTGHRLEMTYVSGLGVNHVRILQGDKLDPEMLTYLARNSSLFCDYFISKADAAKRGEVVTVPVDDVGAIFGGFDQYGATGHIDLRKSAAARAAGDGASLLDVVGGSVEIEASDAGVTRRATLTPRKGVIEYEAGQRLVRRAISVFQADVLWATRDHLLFGTVATRNLEISGYYEGRLTSPAKAAVGGD